MTTLAFSPILVCNIIIIIIPISAFPSFSSRNAPKRKNAVIHDMLTKKTKQVFHDDMEDIVFKCDGMNCKVGIKHLEDFTIISLLSSAHP